MINLLPFFKSRRNYTNLPIICHFVPSLSRLSIPSSRSSASASKNVFARLSIITLPSTSANSLVNPTVLVDRPRFDLEGVREKVGVLKGDLRRVI